MINRFILGKLVMFVLGSLTGIPVLMISCSREPLTKDSGFSAGVYIVNEGGYTKNNGSITYYNKDSGIVHENIFAMVNGRSLGDVVQSFSIAGDIGLIVVNNSQKVEVIDLETFVSLGTITGIDYPRYAMAVSDDKVYLTDGNYQGQVHIIDLNTWRITGQIPVGNGPENLVQSRGYIYVANGGGWDYDHTVSVIDPVTDKVVRNIEVGDHPVDLTVDANLDIWVLCKGRVAYDANWNVVYETDSKLFRIRSDTREIADSFTIGSKGDYFNPIRLTANKDGTKILYAEIDGIYRMDYDAAESPRTVWIPGSYYGLEVDPEDGTIYALKAKGFDSKGKAYLYDESGHLMDSIQTGIAPNGAAFR